MFELDSMENIDDEKPLPYIPVKINGLNVEDLAPQSLFDEPIGRPNIGEGIPIESTLKDVPERPSWLAQVGHEMFKMNKLALAGEFIYDSFNQTSLVDMVPEGFTALKPENIQEFPEAYWDYITSAQSPNDLMARQQKAREQMEDDERFSSGSWSATLAGGALGIFTDPTTYLFPLAVGGKYASIAQNVFLNMGKTAGGLAIDSVSRNLLIQADRIGGNVQDAATDSLRDFIFSTALVGIGGAIGGGLRESKLWNTRKFFNAAADGINVSPVVNEEGIIVKEMHASAIPGASVSAAKVDAANLYIDEVMQMGGLFTYPIIGKPISNFLAWGPLASPVMKAMNSKSIALKSFFNRVVPHGIITQGEALGQAKAFTAHEYAEAYNDEAKTMAQFIRGRYLSANGLEGGSNVKNAIKNFTQTVQSKQTVTEEQFGIEIRNIALIKDYKSQWPQAHEAAEVAIKFFEKMGKDFHEAVGQGNEFLDPRNAFKYLPQNWNLPAMLNDGPKWREITESKLMEQDAAINQLQEPIKSMESQIEFLKTSNASKNTIKNAEAQLFRFENELSNKLIDNPDLHVLLEDRVLFSQQERNQLNNLLTPLRMAKANKIAIEAKLKPLEKEKKARGKDESVQLKIDKARFELEEIEKLILEEEDKLQRSAREGEINKKFFHREGDEFIFHDPNKRPKFRKLFESELELKRYAQQAYDSILNQTPDDLIQGVFGSLSPGIIEAPKYLKERHLLFDTTEHNNLGFLDPDISKSIASYASNMGKIIGFKKALPEFSESKGIDGVLGYFQSEYEKNRAEIESKPASEQRTKEINKLRKEYEKDKKLMSDTYKVYMGTYSAKNPELQRFTSSLKNLVASAKLGAVPIYQLAELGAIIMKQGVMPFLATGLRPMVKSLNGHLKGIEAEERRQNAASAHLALWTTRNGYADKLINSNKMSYAKVSSISEKVGIATDNLAHASGNLFGINYIANANETMAANIFQSDVMIAAFAHKNKTLTQKQIVKMARYGIDIKKYSDRFIKEYEQAEGFEMYGGYYSKYYKWNDLEASNLMSMGMRRMVKDTIVNADKFSSPYWAQDPIFNMLFMFHGWAYGALTHYSIPLMQRPDAENMLGMLMVVGLSLAAEPLKRIANGKEPYDNDSTWFEETYKAIDYSGLFGPYADWLQSINSATGGSILPGLISEKYKNRPSNPLGGGGPVFGYLSDVATSVGHGIKGDWTENDVKRFERLFPLSSFLPIRALANKWIESMDLPKTRKSANTWAYRQFLYGENK